METPMQSRIAAQPVVARSLANSYDTLLDAMTDAGTIFRSAVGAYVENEPENTCWQQAHRIAEQLRKANDLEQVLETTAFPGSALAERMLQALDPLRSLSRLLGDMKRQVTAFAIDSGATDGGDKRMPEYLVADVLDLTNEVCAAVDALIEDLRASVLWSVDARAPQHRRSVSMHENEADRLSMLLLQRILRDEQLDVESKLALAQVVEEIDHVADSAEGIDRELHARRRLRQPSNGAQSSR